MRTVRVLSALFLVAVMIPAVASAQGDDKGPVNSLRYTTGYTVLDTFNAGGVNNGPSSLTTFVLTQPSVITQIQTYHWNNGGGAPLGNVKIVGPSGVTYGPWNAQGIAGQGTKFWVVTPNVELPAGTYIIQDSGNATWSCNAESKNKGFAKVLGKK
jgi:hypothetical protein